MFLAGYFRCFSVRIKAKSSVKTSVCSQPGVCFCHFPEEMDVSESVIVVENWHVCPFTLKWSHLLSICLSCFFSDWRTPTLKGMALLGITANFLGESITTVFVDTRLSKRKHPRKRFPKFPSVGLRVTDSHQSQPLAWPSDLLYVMLASCYWWISIRSVDNMYDWRKF